MKKILILMPFNESHRKYVESIAAGCECRYSSRETVTAEEAADADIILGNVPPHLLGEAKHLEWIQLNSAGSDAYCKPGVLRPAHESSGKLCHRCAEKSFPETGLRG